jgi:RNA polymerase sigma factor (sigma-70 family)
MPDACKDLPEEAHEALIRVAQMYLRRRSQALTPGPVVTMYWQDFCRLYIPVVQLTLRYYIAQPIDRDDVFQEVWLTIAQKLPDFQWLGSSYRFRAWMGQVIRHKAVDMIRRQRRLSNCVPSELHKADCEVLTGETDPAQAAERLWRRELVHLVLAKLRPTIKETNFYILHLHYWEGLTVPEIVNRVGLSTVRVSCRLHRLLRKLRQAFASYVAEDSGKKRDRRQPGRAFLKVERRAAAIGSAIFQKEKLSCSVHGGKK